MQWLEFVLTEDLANQTVAGDGVCVPTMIGLDFFPSLAGILLSCFWSSENSARKEFRASANQKPGGSLSGLVHACGDCHANRLSALLPPAGVLRHPPLLFAPSADTPCRKPPLRRPSHCPALPPSPRRWE